MSRVSAILRVALASVLLFVATRTEAHPVPFSYLDLKLGNGAGAGNAIAGVLVIHDFDAAYELGLLSQDTLLDANEVARQKATLLALLSRRLSLELDGVPATIEWGELTGLPERQSLRFDIAVRGTRPGRVHLSARLFPYDPVHQTFVNVYEDGSLVQQVMLDLDHRTTDFYTGSAQGRLAVVRTFLLSGIEHILIGPDHILFLIGLLLLGGALPRLALIVTSFTIGHSITLSLAALDLVSPPARLIEPLIALTIIVVGTDNLMVLRNRRREEKPSTDIRAWLAGVFGLIHGFGFAYVLKEFGLPQAALVWSLFAFNVGVEIGQLLIVVAAASLLALVARRSASAATNVASLGSVAVILAGAFWFVERTFFPGGF